MNGSVHILKPTTLSWTSVRGEPINYQSTNTVLQDTGSQSPCLGTDNNLRVANSRRRLTLS